MSKSCSVAIARIKPAQADFAEWNRKRDSEEIVWKYRKSLFVPQMGSRIVLSS